MILVLMLVLFASPAWAINCASPLIGVHQDLVYVDPANYPTEVSDAQGIAAQISRSNMAWWSIEPTQGNQDWTRPDKAIQALVGGGIEPMFFFHGSPQWVNGSSDPSVVPSDPTAFNTFVTNWANFATQAVNRYKLYVHKWEIWNEENDIGFWKPGPITGVTQYAQLYNAMRTAILAADPTAQVAIGGLSGGCCTGPNGEGGFTFLQQLYTAGVTVDIVNVHPYPVQNQAPGTTIPFTGNFTDIAQYRTIMTNNGHTGPMWVTEWGWDVSVVGATNQNTYVAQSLNMLQTLYPYVQVATYFWLTDQFGSLNYGLYDPSGVARPAVSSFAARTN